MFAAIRQFIIDIFLGLGFYASAFRRTGEVVDKETEHWQQRRQQEHAAELKQEQQQLEQTIN